MFEDKADVLILGWGMLNNWEWPKVEGLHSFKGPYMHSADYDESFDATGKTVAVVGGGSSGIQILPQIQKVAKHVDHYMRSQNWIAPLGFGAVELEKRKKLAEGNCELTRLHCVVDSDPMLTMCSRVHAGGEGTVPERPQCLPPTPT